ncbi:hypothetical protein COOONC_10032 [Cooperia oncophora]
MYTFVLEWTPALSKATFAPIPHGYIFASFMVATMMGSSIFKLLSRTIRPESFMRYVLLMSCCLLGCSYRHAKQRYVRVYRIPCVRSKFF